MCINVPVRIVELLGDKKALVRNMLGEDTIVSIELLGCATLGDYVVVENGSALQKIDPQEVTSAISLAGALADMIQMNRDLSQIVLAY